MKAGRVSYIASLSMLVIGLLVVVLAVRTRYSCGDGGVAFTTSWVVADSVCNPAGLSPKLFPRTTPAADHRWAVRIPFAFAFVFVAASLARLGTRFDGAESPPRETTPEGA